MLLNMDDSSVRQKMHGVLDLVTSDIAQVRTGKASPSLVSELEVVVYGGQQKLRILELGTVSAPDPQTIVIDPWDKSIIGDIRKGIEAANIGFNPSIDSEIIRISIPPITGEDRQKFVKLLSAKIENGKVMIRQIRADFMHDIKKSFEEKEMSEDEKFAAEKKLQDLTDEFVGKIEEMGKKKEADILQI